MQPSPATLSIMLTTASTLSEYACAANEYADVLIVPLAVPKVKKFVSTLLTNTKGLTLQDSEKDSYDNDGRVIAL